MVVQVVVEVDMIITDGPGASGTYGYSGGTGSSQNVDKLVVEVVLVAWLDGNNRNCRWWDGTRRQLQEHRF